jgi:PKD repeat protein
VVFDAGSRIGQPPAALVAPSSLAPSDVLTTTVDEPTFQQISDAVPPVLFNAEASAPIDVVTYSPASGSGPLHVAFDGSASTTPTGTVTSWVWDFGDSTVGSGAIVTHTYSALGTYFATLRVTNSGGNVNLVALEHRVTVGALAELFLPFVGR